MLVYLIRNCAVMKNLVQGKNSHGDNHGQPKLVIFTQTIFSVTVPLHIASRTMHEQFVG